MDYQSECNVTTGVVDYWYIIIRIVGIFKITDNIYNFWRLKITVFNMVGKRTHIDCLCCFLNFKRMNKIISKSYRMGGIGKAW